MKYNSTNHLTILKKAGEKKFIALSSGILMILVVHFFMQMSFINSENVSAKAPEIDLLAPAVVAEVPVSANDSVQFSAPSKVSVPEVPEAPVVEENAVPRKNVKRNAAVKEPKVNKEPKIQRESRAERIRRAEHFLTGV